MNTTPEPNPYRSPQSSEDPPRRFPLGAMSLGDILSRSFGVLIARLPVFFAIQFIAYVPLIVMVLYFGAFRPESMFATWYALASALLSIILSAFATAAVLKVIEQEHVHRKAGVGEALSFALARALPLIVTSIVFGLVVGVGFVLLIIPGLIFMVMFAFASQACVLERLGPIRAMDRSQKLTAGYRWRVFGIFLVVGVVTFLVDSVLEFILNKGFPIAAVLGGELTLNRTNLMVMNLVPQLFSILVSTYGSICITLTYFDLRVRKEQYDFAVAEQSSDMSGV